MADKDSKTPLYDKHKKVHDLVGRLNDINEAKETTGLYSKLHEVASNYLHKNKGDDGKINWSEKGGDEAHKKFSDSIWDATADHIAKNYLNMSDAAIKELKGKKTKDGGNAWEDFIAHYLGGMDKDAFFNEVKDENELTIHNILDSYVNKVAGRHVGYRRGKLLRSEIKTAEHSDQIASYLSDAKKQNKKALKPFKHPKKFKSVDEAIEMLNTAAQYIPKNYHPDRKDTHY
jgi:hypothetical protein